MKEKSALQSIVKTEPGLRSEERNTTKNVGPSGRIRRSHGEMTKGPEAEVLAQRLLEKEAALS